MVNPQTTLVEISASYQGEKSYLEQGIAKSVAEMLKARTGLAPDDVTLRDVNYTVRLENLADDRHSTADGPTLDDALREATEEGAEYRTTVKVEVHANAETPYFKVDVVSRSLSPHKLPEYQAEAVRELHATYGERLNSSPDGLSYRVVKVDRELKGDTSISKGNFQHDNVLAVGKSAMSLDDALAKARLEGKAVKRVKAIVYEQTATMVIYGAPEHKLVIRDGVTPQLVSTSTGGPTVITDLERGKGVKYQEGGASPASRVVAAAAIRRQASTSSSSASRGRGGAPAGAVPIELTHDAELM